MLRVFERGGRNVEDSMMEHWFELCDVTGVQFGVVMLKVVHIMTNTCQWWSIDVLYLYMCVGQ